MPRLLHLWDVATIGAKLARFIEPLDQGLQGQQGGGGHLLHARQRFDVAPGVKLSTEGIILGLELPLLWG
ncbi:MAG: hypothetical protein AB1609_18480 [Bacillota bacterium]